MSGSFWKFGQDYSIESSVTKLLNRAFIKINNNNTDTINNSIDKDNDEIIDSIVNITTTTITNSSTESGSPIDEPDVSINNNDDDNNNTNNNNDKDDDDDEEDTDTNNKDTTNTLDKLPSNEEDYRDYRPDLNVLDDLLDDEELYTELMCSNFKLLIYLKYPEVLQRLIDFVTNEKILTDDFEETKVANNDLLSDSENQNNIGDLNSDVIIVEPTKDNESGETIIKNKISEGYEEIDTNLKDESDASSMISEETSVTVPPESEEQLESRRARMAAEILSADIWPIASTIMENTDLLEQLWSIMDHKPPLSVAASTYFMKINERLLDMDVNGMLTFILSQKSCAERFLNHIENPSLMDFLLKVISTDKQDSPTGIINCLKEQDLIPSLIERLDLDKYNTSVQSAAGDFLKAFVTLSANSNNEIALGIGPNELTRQLVSTEIIEKLINIMLKGSTSLSNGVGIIIEMIRKNNSDYDFIQVMYTTIKTHPPNDRDPVHLIALVKTFANHMGDFAKLLMHGGLPMLETPIGEIEPLGFERFKICELVAELLHCSNMALLNEPDGEKITSERDYIRQEYLKEEETAYEDTIEKMSDSLENEYISDKLEALKLNGSETDRTTNENDIDDESLNEPVNNEELIATDENDNEVYPDDEIDNSKSAEKALREKNLSGDQLKFALHDTGIITNIMDMFFQFEWNNFLHNVVFDIVQQIFNGPLKSGYNKFLLSGLLVNIKITDKIIKGDEICKENETRTGIRLGYMGHLTLIAEEVAKFVEYVEELKLTFNDNGVETALSDEAWVTFMDTTLRDVREKYNTVLGDFVLEDVDAEDYEDHLIDANDPDLQMEENNALLDKLTEQNIDIDPLDELHDQIESTHDSFDQNDNLVHKENEDYIETNEEPNTESFYKYSHDLEEDTIRHDTQEDEDSRASGTIYEYIDPSGHKTTLNLDSFHSDSDSDNDSGTNSNYEDALKYVYTNQFRLSDNDKAHEQFSNTLQNDFIDYSPPNGEDDDDDYMDPNDDGQSYVKPNNPLFNNLNTLSSNITLNEDEMQSRNSESGSDIESPEEYSSDEDVLDSEEIGMDNEVSLYRTPSRED